MYNVTILKKHLLCSKKIWQFGLRQMFKKLLSAVQYRHTHGRNLADFYLSVLRMDCRTAKIILYQAFQVYMSSMTARNYVLRGLTSCPHNDKYNLHMYSGKN